MTRSEDQRLWAGGLHIGDLHGVQVVSAGNQPAKAYQMNWLADSWGIALVWKGAGWYRADRSGPFQQADGPFFFFVWPGSEFEYGPDDQWDESFVCFSGERCAHWEACGWLRRQNRLYQLSQDVEAVQRIHEQLLDHCMSGEPARADLAKCLCEQLVCMLNAQKVHEPATNPCIERIEKVTHEWKSSPSEFVDLKQTAERLNMSYTNFRRVFFQVTGNTPYQYLAAQRISHACQLLVTSGASVKEIAMACGFQYVESFNRLFRQHTGKSPSQYRQTHFASGA